jgi:hypothetical protein
LVPFARLASELFFSPELEVSEKKFLERNPARKKGTEVRRVDHPYQLSTGRWMDFLEVNHEQTPYSDAHLCVPYNLIQATAFTRHNVHDASTFTSIFNHLNQLCSREALIHMRTLMKSVNFFLQRKDYKRAHLLVMSLTQSLEEKFGHECVGNQC